MVVKRCCEVHIYRKKYLLNQLTAKENLVRILYSQMDELKARLEFIPTDQQFPPTQFKLDRQEENAKFQLGVFKDAIKQARAIILHQDTFDEETREFVKRATGLLGEDASELTRSSSTYKNARKHFIKWMLEKQKGKIPCYYCGCWMTDNNLPPNKHHPILTIDHVIPISKGGSLIDFDNMVCACHKCNSLKGNKNISRSKMRRQMGVAS